MEFGKVSGAVVSGIFEEVMLGCCCGFRVFGGKCWVELGSGRDEGDVENLGEFGGRIGRDLSGVGG